MENTRDILAQMQQVFRRDREQLKMTTAAEMLRMALISIGKWPTEGELLTFLIRLNARLNNVFQALLDASADVRSREQVAFWHTYWTTERQAELPPQALEKLAIALALTEQDIRARFGSYWGENTPEKRFEQTLLNELDELDEKEMFRNIYWPWNDAQKKFNGVTFEQAVAPVFRPIIEKSGLPELILKELLENLEPGENRDRNFAYRSTISGWIDGVNTLITDLRLQKTGLRVAEVDKSLNLTEVVKLFEKNLNLTCCTALEHSLGENLAAALVWITDEPTEDNSRYYLLEALYSIQRDWNREAFFRFFEVLGVNPNREAERVVERDGHSGYPANYYLYPTDRGYVVCLVASPRMPHDNYVLLLRGGMNEATKWIAENHSPVDFDREYLHTVKDANVATKNAFVHFARDPEVVTKQLASREQITTQLAELESTK